MKNVDIRKFSGTIIGLIAFVFCLIFFTYAWYEWRSGNTTLGGNITDSVSIDITLDNDGDIESTNIAPVLNIEDGVVGGFSADNKDFVPGHLYIDLKINSIDSELLSEDLKYLIVKSVVSPRSDDNIDKNSLVYDYDNPVASGDFSNFKVATNLMGEDNVQPQTITFYKILIYVDGNVQNNINLQGKSIDAKLIITDTNIKYLNEVPVGSYVAYTGNNGCEGDACSGVNANYEEGVTDGWCAYSDSEFNSNGWRVAYTKEGNVHLISAGAPYCLCSTNDTTTSSEVCYNYYNSPDSKNSMNEGALLYCNPQYAFEGKCDNTTTWAIKDDDFYNITGNQISNCFNESGYECGEGNPIIDVGSYYYFADSNFYGWFADKNTIDLYYSNEGVRPVIKLDENVVVTGGEGTEENPYRIEKITKGVLATEHIVNLFNDGSSITETTVGDGPQTVSLNEAQRIMMVDQGTINGVDYGVEYRYYGNDLVEDPSTDKYLTKNYVEFNGELWRIISSSKVFSSTEDTIGEQRVKLIRVESFSGDYGWAISDETINQGRGINDWSQASLMCSFNVGYALDEVTSCSSKTYYSLNDVLDLNSKKLIDNALWYLGGINLVNGLYADDYYTQERGTNVYIGNLTRWGGKVGLIYPSDYIYSADLSVCKKSGYSVTEVDAGEFIHDDYDVDEKCYNSTWLYKSNLWTITPFYSTDYSYSDVVIIIDKMGANLNTDLAMYGGHFNPVVYLKSNVIITGGKGTSGEPYKIALG